MAVDVVGARCEIARCPTPTTTHSPSVPDVIGFPLETRGSGDEIIASAQVVEQIVDRVLPAWRPPVPCRRTAPF
ncbi:MULTISPECIES: hypothetical protein [Streptomyces]|uniref:Uncharacterized protein n=2 Tax=Streptomyces TaxID=1883 RepID=A0ABU4K2B8_9ACTN|nr:hypothetical protein [Streptomyces roseolus]MDX2291900.1 hypothetical protein [Streptomyces roseolus]